MKARMFAFFDGRRLQGGILYRFVLLQDLHRNGDAGIGCASKVNTEGDFNLRGYCGRYRVVHCPAKRTSSSDASG